MRLPKVWVRCKRIHPYDLGWKRNWCEVMGNVWWLWFVPVQNWYVVLMCAGLCYIHRGSQRTRIGIIYLKYTNIKRNLYLFFFFFWVWIRDGDGIVYPMCVIEDEESHPIPEELDTVQLLNGTDRDDSVRSD